MTENLGSAHDVEIEGDEDGFVLYLDVEDGTRYRVNIHAVAEQLVAECGKIRAWLAEGEAARIGYSVKVPDDLDAYEPNDPKRWGREFL